MDKSLKIGLFIPCYVNAVYPEVVYATYKVAKYLDKYDYPMNQPAAAAYGPMQV